MARPASIPKLTLHKASGKAVVRLSGVDVYCGIYGTPEAKEAYDRSVAEWLARGRTPEPNRFNDQQTGHQSSEISVNEVLHSFWQNAEKHYRGPEGKATSQLAEYRQTIRIIRQHYGMQPAAKFGPLALKAVREQMILANLARSEVNRRVMLARRIFKWAAGEELIPFEIYQRLTTVNALPRGRSPARETDPIRPVSDDEVDVTLPHLNTQVRGLIQFIRLTGCRPGEACRLRRCDLDTNETIWLYRPEYHKNSHRGKTRVVAIGPKAQELLRDYPTSAPDEFIFSPKRAMEEWKAKRAADRKTPRYPSHMKRNIENRVNNAERTPGERYRTEALDRAVARVCDRLHPPPAAIARKPKESEKAWSRRLTPEQKAELKAWRATHSWAPNQLRHTRGTTIRRIYGLEAAQSVLGHEKANTTEIYAEKNLALAARVAREIG